MSAVTIKAAIATLLGGLSNPKAIYTNYPATVDPADGGGGPVIIVTEQPGTRERRIAWGNGASVPVGLKEIAWRINTQVWYWGEDAVNDAAAFDTILANIETLYRSTIGLTVTGSRVPYFAQDMQINRVPVVKTQNSVLVYEADIVTMTKEWVSA